MWHSEYQLLAIQSATYYGFPQTPNNLNRSPFQFCSNTAHGAILRGRQLNMSKCCASSAHPPARREENDSRQNSSRFNNSKACWISSEFAPKYELIQQALLLLKRL